MSFIIEEICSLFGNFSLRGGPFWIPDQMRYSELSIIKVISKDFERGL
jgi:hypothetical protein